MTNKTLKELEVAYSIASRLGLDEECDKILAEMDKRSK